MKANKAADEKGFVAELLRFAFEDFLDRLFFFPRTFFLALGLVGAVLLGSFQACAIHIPAAPDVQGNREGGFSQHLAGERLVAVCDGAGAVKFQETGRIGGHGCMGDLGRPSVDQGIRE